MFPTVFFSAAIGVVVALAIVSYVFVRVALAGPYASAAAPAHAWRPPLARPAELLSWASATAKATVARRLAQRRDARTARLVAAEMYAGVRSAIAQSPLKSQPARFECPSRRHEMIGVTAPEALAIAEELRSTRRSKNVQQIRDGAAVNARTIATMDGRQYAGADVVCPLLRQSGACLAFACRPLQCRAWQAAEVESSEEECPGRCSESITSYASAVCQGIEEGLSKGLEAAGLDGQRYELNSALATALDTPHAAERWIDGEPVFEHCKIYH